MEPFNPDYLKIYKNRVKLINAAQDPRRAASIRNHYRYNPIDFINDFVETYDPRNAAMPYLPFALFQKQVDFIHFLQSCLKDKEAGLVEKSRDVGASWLCCAFAVWLLLFHSGSSVGFGSRVVDDVDKIGKPDSLFQKMRIILKRLPAFLLPPMPIDDGYMKIINPYNGSVITGGSGDNIGRGGRSSIFFKDESAHYEHAELIEAALSANTDVQIDISSVNGTNNVFYKRRKAGMIWTPGAEIPQGKTRVFIFDWRDNPLKNQHWYDVKRKKWEDDGLLHIFAQEVDRDYSASVAGVIIPAIWVKAAIDAHKKLGIKEDGIRMAGLDVADDSIDRDKNAISVRYGVVLKHCSSWGGVDTGVTARNALLVCKEMGVTVMNYDCIGVGAGVKAETNRLIDEAKAAGTPLTVDIYPMNVGLPPDAPEQRLIPGDPQSPKNEDFYENLKAQAWWSLRTRFEKTYKMVIQGIAFPHDELISIDSTIPNLHELEEELSQPTRKASGKGKMMIDKKPGNNASPNLADSVMYCYTQKISRGWFS